MKPGVNDLSGGEVVGETGGLSVTIGAWANAGDDVAGQLSVLANKASTAKLGLVGQFPRLFDHPLPIGSRPREKHPVVLALQIIRWNCRWPLNSPRLPSFPVQQQPERESYKWSGLVYLQSVRFDSRHATYGYSRPRPADGLVETDAELNTLRSLGVTAAQGYRLGRPGPLSLDPPAAPRRTARSRRHRSAAWR
jgi:hypothetical protein